MADLFASFPFLCAAEKWARKRQKRPDEMIRPGARGSPGRKPSQCGNAVLNRVSLIDVCGFARFIIWRVGGGARLNDGVSTVRFQRHCIINDSVDSNAD